jgi:hypothetical protein
MFLAQTVFVTVWAYTVMRRYRWRYKTPCAYKQQSCAASHAAVRWVAHFTKTWGETQYVGVGSVT